MTRKALGRGLSALIREPEAPPASQAYEVADRIAVDQIDPNPLQPRTSFGEAELQELADSIRAKGVIQPILVRRAADRYQLVAGERRWRAARLAGLDAVPAIVLELDDREALELALTENLLRDDLGALEAARAYKILQDRFGLSHDEIGARLGINRVTVTNTLRLLRLPERVQEMIEKRELTAGHARALLGVEDKNRQITLAARIARRGLSVREAERIAGVNQPRRPGQGKGPPMDPNVRAATTELERKLGTRVRITGNGQRGQIEIKYFSAEDLIRLYQLMRGS